MSPSTQLHFFSVNRVLASLHRQNSGQYKHKFDKFSEESLLKCRECAIQVGHHSTMSRQGSQQEIMQQAIKNVLRIMQKYKSGLHRLYRFDDAT